MIACFDASFLILLFDEHAAAPIDPDTGAPVTHCQDRIRHLLTQHSKTKGSRLIIPAPALGEFLVRTDPLAAPELLTTIQRLRGCKISPFAERAAVEFAEMQRTILAEVRKKPTKGEVQSRSKAKFDQQIVAIAKAEGASTIYTDDNGLARYAERFQISAVRVASLPLSPESRQGVLPLEPPEPAMAEERNEL